MQYFSAQDPSAIAATLAKGLKATDALVAEVEKSSLSAEQKYNVLHELRVKQQQFNTALIASLGISVEADIVPATQAGGLFLRRCAERNRAFRWLYPAKAFM